jgi:hypothetical protein
MGSTSVKLMRRFRSDRLPADLLHDVLHPEGKTLDEVIDEVDDEER